MLCALLGHHIKASTQLHTFYRINTHKPMGQLGIQAVKNWFAQPNGHIFGHDGYPGTNRVALFAKRLHIGFQLWNLGCIGKKERVIFNFSLVKTLRHYGAQLGYIAKYLYAQTLFQVLFSNATRSHTHGRFPG